MGRGHRMKDVYPSRKLRRFELRDLVCYLVRPSTLMPDPARRMEQV